MDDSCIKIVDAWGQPCQGWGILFFLKKIRSN